MPPRDRTGGGFRLLWLADTVNQLSSSVRVAAVPLVAVTVLAVPPFQLGLLVAAGTAAFLLIGLPAGAWVDRLPHREVLRAANLARAGLLASVPLAGWLGLLSYGQLLVVALLGGAMTVLVDIACAALVPAVVGPAGRAGANARMQATQAAGRTAGPALAGTVAALLGAAGAVGTAAAGHLAAAVLVSQVRGAEPGPRPPRRSVRAEVAEGLRFAFQDRSLRALAAFGASYNVAVNIGFAMHVLFLVQELRLPMPAVGLMLAATGLGSVAGAATSGRWARRFGGVRSMLVVLGCSQPFLALIALAGGGWSVALFPAGAAASGYGLAAYNVLQTTFRQAVCPPYLYGRVTASSRFLTWGAIPFGGLLGGLLGELLGLRGALWAAALGGLLSGFWLLASPLRSRRDAVD